MAVSLLRVIFIMLYSHGECVVVMDLQAVLLDVGCSLAVGGQHGLKTLWRAIARENSEDRLTLQLVTGLSRGTRYFRASIAPCADNVKYRRLIRTFLTGMWCLLSQEQRAKLKIYSHLSKHAGVSTLAFRELLYQNIKPKNHHQDF